MKHFNHGLVVCLMFLLTSCQSVAAEVDVNARAPRVMKLYMTVDWEGRSLEEENIEAMQAFRQQFPAIPILQLMNPAYFVRDHPNKQWLTKVIKSTFLPIDTLGLHVHAWKSLTNYCGVRYRYGYSFAGADEQCKTGDCGYTVSLENAYSKTDLTKLIACSNQILVDHGFSRPKHFRAGGWQLGLKLAAALEANGFVWDSSEIDADLLTTRWHEESGMVKMLRQLHPKRTPLDQPYARTATLMEYPNNAALADYTTAKQIVAIFKQLLEARKEVMVLGFHQETAADFLGRVANAIPKMEAIAEAHGVKIEWVSE